MVTVLSQKQNAVGFDSCVEMDNELKNEKDDAKETLDDDLLEEGEITDDEVEPAVAPEPQTSSLRLKSHSSSHHRSHYSPSRSSRSKNSSSHNSSSAKHSKPAPKYKDFDGKTTKPSGGEEIMMESWINGVQKKRRLSPVYDSNEEYYSVSKADAEVKEENQSIQPEILDEYGDVDYRQQIDEFDTQKRSRRRSGSPIDDFGTAKRPRNELNEELPFPPPVRRGPVKNRWTERTICKFFREGYCREGDSCVYSHNAADSNRRPELCRFYAQGYCKRGLACPNLHGEYPCKAFNKGECSKEQCQFSHQPLNDYTKPIFEQMMRDEELAIKLLNNAGIKPCRKVLLPEGPEGCDMYFNDETITNNRAAIPPPGVVVPTLSNGAQLKAANPTTTAATSSSYGFFNAFPAHTQGKGQPNNSPHSHQASALSTNRRTSPPQTEKISITEMMGNFGKPNTAASTNVLSPSLIQDSLQSLQSMFDNQIVDESPKSPPQSGIVVSDSAPVIPTTRGYVAYPLYIPDTCNNFDLNLIQQITSGHYKNDPRLKRMAEKQFNLVSKTLEQKGLQAVLNQQKVVSNSVPMLGRQNPVPPVQQSASQQIPSINTHAKPVDPRARDPRTARAASTTNDSTPVPYSTESEEFRSMVERQIQMADEMAKQSSKPEDLDMRAHPSHYEAPSRSNESYYERRPRFGNDRGRGVPRGHSNRFHRHGEEHGKRFHQQDDRNWNENLFDPRGPNTTSTLSVQSVDTNAEEEQTKSKEMTMREKRKHNVYESPLARRF